jgi:hypothetical protein
MSFTRLRVRPYENYKVLRDFWIPCTLPVSELCRCQGNEDRDNPNSHNRDADGQNGEDEMG